LRGSFFGVAVARDTFTSVGSSTDRRSSPEHRSLYTTLSFWPSLLDCFFPLMTKRRGSTYLQLVGVEARDLRVHGNGIVRLAYAHVRRMKHLRFRLEPVVQRAPVHPSIAFEDLERATRNGIINFIHPIDDRFGLHESRRQTPGACLACQASLRSCCSLGHVDLPPLAR
jgi:hypothetical protein